MLFRSVRARVAHVRGIVRNRDTGEPVHQLALQLISLDALAGQTLNGTAVAVSNHGAFEFPRVLPGEYAIVAQDATPERRVARLDVSVGRSDLPGGNHEVLMRSIVDVLFPLGDDAIVHPGHGPDTTIARERGSNPFVLEFLGAR